MAVSSEPTTVAGVTPPALAVGLVAGLHVVALVVLPASPTLGTLAGLEALALVLVVAVTGFADGLGRGRVAVGACYIAAVGIAWAIGRSADLLVAALAVITGLALLGYGLHRYELVALGLVEATDE